MLAAHRRQTADAVLAEGTSTVDTDLDGLEQAVDAAWGRYCDRLVLAAPRGQRLLARLDALQRTDRPELMDLPELGEERRARLLGHMDRFNRAFRSYAVQARILSAAFARARGGAARGRPVRWLDVASGRGGFPRHVAATTRWPLEVTGSDVQPSHVAHAQAQGGSACFRVLNGFDMGDLESGAHDVVSCEQSLHHFTPGQLARLIREGARVATTAFVGIDGIRSPLLGVGIVSAAAAVSRSTDFTHDAFVTARRLYHDEELRFIARLACPGARVEIARHLPGFVSVTIG